MINAELINCDYQLHKRFLFQALKGLPNKDPIQGAAVAADDDELDSPNHSLDSAGSDGDSGVGPDSTCSRYSWILTTFFLTLIKIFTLAINQCILYTYNH